MSDEFDLTCRCENGCMVECVCSCHDQCPAGGEHTPVDDSTENDDMRHWKPGRGFHCDHCGVSLPSPEREP